MPRIRAVVTDPYYEQPSWLSRVENPHIAYLSRNSSPEDVSIFLTVLCGMNDIEINQEPRMVIKKLIKLEDVALSGGISFEGQGKEIVPSCCCGLEQWNEVSEAVSSKKDPWLGHDPFPSIQYDADNVRIWSDDYFGVMKSEPPTELEKQNMFFVEYSYKNLIEQLEGIKLDLLQFYKYPLVEQLSMVDTKLLDTLFLKYCSWLGLDNS